MAETKTRRRGHVERIGENRWQLRWFLGCDNGQRQYKRRTITGTKKEAERALAEELRRVEGGFVDPGTRTVGSVVDEWLAMKASLRKLTARTLRDYEYQAKHWLKPRLGPMQLRACRFEDVQSFVTGLATDGIGAETIRRVCYLLNASLEYAVRMRWLTANPARGVELPKKAERKIEALSTHQIRAFRSAIRGTRFEALFVLLLETGMRPSEAFALTWSDLELDAATVRIRRALERLGSKARIRESTKTPAARRAIRISVELVTLLRAMKASRAEAALKAGTRADLADQLVFVTLEGNALDPANLIRRYFKRAVEAAGLPASTRLYDLRHASASLLVAAGVNVRTVAQRLGHTDPGFTLRTYVQALDEAQAQAVEALRAALGV
jgi:integrase